MAKADLILSFVNVNLYVPETLHVRVFEKLKSEVVYSEVAKQPIIGKEGWGRQGES